ncbi:ABC transporter permease [Patescibacteria group bacterium]|nr:ABC transporter permease [Patescibacteria group bacterium]
MDIVKELVEVCRHGELLGQITAREIKSRYKQSVLGYLWVIVNPLFQMLVMSFAFSVVLKIPTNASENIPYSIFLYVALLPWTLFANSLASASNSLVGNSSLITKIYFPRTILVISTVIAKVVDFFYASTILIIYLVVLRIPINLNVLWVIPIFIIQMIFTLGLSFFLAAANLLYRDIQYLLGLVLMLWMYLTPVIYPADIVPEKLRFIYQLNPMSVIINAYRQTILGGGMPNLTSLGIGVLVSIVTLLIGLKYFKIKEKIFADNI